MSVSNFMKLPEGVLPKYARHIGIGSLLVVMLLIVLSSSNRTPSRKPAAPSPLQRAADPNAIRRLEETLADAQRRYEADKAKLTSVQQETRALQQEGFLPGIQTPDAPAQPQLDPIEEEKKRFRLEMFKREQMRAFASPEALSLGETYTPARETESAFRETKSTPVETASTKVETPAEKKYMIREGNFLETVLINRLDSTFTGPLQVQVSNDLWSRDRTVLLIPKGTIALGEARQVTGRNQVRIAMMFHRLIRPDDVAIDLDKYVGLNQIGETGAKDKVNNHYMQIFGVSIALGVVGAAAQGTASYGYGAGGWDVVRGGFGQGMSQAAMQVMNRFLNIPPTVTVREGYRIKVYFTQDLEVPAYRRTE